MILLLNIFKLHNLNNLLVHYYIFMDLKNLIIIPYYLVSQEQWELLLKW